MELHILWGDWIAQPPQHRALYIEARNAEAKMNAIDDGERAMLRWREDQKAGRR